MAPDIIDYEHLMAGWPAPVQLSHPGGDVFLTFSLRQNYIEARWNGHVMADDIVLGAKVYLRLLSKTPVSRLLNDKTDATGDWAEANDWLEFEWLPEALQAGLQRMAYVYSNNMFSRLSSRDLIQRLTPSLTVQHFDESAFAVVWLLSLRSAEDVTKSS